MSPQLVNFFLCSVCLHVAAFGLLYQVEPATGHLVHATSHTAGLPGLMTALLIANDTEVKPAPSATMKVRESAPQPESVPDPKFAITGRQTQATEAPGFLAGPNSPGSVEESQQENALAGQNVNLQEFLPVDRLSLLPSPATPIDLNQAAGNEIAIDKKMELTILVDAEGSVVNVFTSIMADEPERAFADRVAALFKNTRFTPAEIDGRAVKSRLQIVVLSEKLAAIERPK